MARLEIKGLDKLEKQLKESATMNDVKKAIRFHGGQLENKMTRNADFTQGYQTGQTKQSVSLDITDGGFTAEVGPTTEHSEYLEYGTRFMDAQPFVKPSLDAQAKEFERYMQTLVR